MGADGDSVDAGDSAAAAAAAVGGGATVHIRSSNGSKFSVQTDLESTVGSFKVVLAEKCDVPPEQQRLIYKGRILKDEQTLASYGVESDHTIHLVRGFASSTASTDRASRTPNSISEVARGVDSNEGGGSGAAFGGSPFPGLDANMLGGSGGSNLFGFGLPEFGQVQQQLTQNPTMMREIMNLPVFQSLMNNPELLHNMIMNNPQMREIIDRNPDLAHVLNDPSTLRQALEAVRNPELMREMMRNTDRAMSNIESSPEGFNMLRRMYETVQEPFLNATTMTRDAGSDLGSNPFAALLGNQGATQSRDPSPNPSTTGSEATTGSAEPNANPLPNPWGSAAGGPQTTNSRSSPASDARTSGAGLGRLGLPELERMAGGMADPSHLNQIMQNPAMMQMMQSLLSNPQFMNQILGLNPQLRNLVESNTQMRDMLQNPEFIRQLTSPETLQQLLSLQRSLFSQLGRQQASRERNPEGNGAGTPNITGLDSLMNMFGGLGGAGGLGVPNTSNVPPEQLYATQLSQLQEMGFLDTQENIRALSATAGNVHAAVERLLRDIGQ
ncbi:ubiquitin domain-containing protein DSK2a-like isoform X2 [Phoenix dactylifera]|uniref:Ubiquitin domain-containing protein DSK2a-like isoform X2 n=1 Tax=Phoenix dactylifera TaxID=42345 RepID=A0A8B7D372_PHODC|nr:ubiquitin domain-containing protein DSK2a-like isoform X2 [Phoenix dactylifera]